MLQLVADGVLREPVLYSSLFFKTHAGVVVELTNRQRGRVFAYRRYVDELAAEAGGGG